MTISKQDQTKIQKELQAAIAEVCARHNLTAPTIDLRRATTGTFVRMMKTDIFTKDIAGQALQAFRAPAKAKIEDIAEQYGLCLVNRKGDRLVDYVPSRPKYPFVYESAGGTRWKAALIQVKDRFAKAA
jgi:Mg-chelatase subunit ChlI